MPPKAMSQAAIEGLITQKVNVALEMERARQREIKKDGKVLKVAMTTTQNKGVAREGPPPTCNRCGACHYGHCTIKCHKCGKIGHKERTVEERRSPL
nr:hypothetical protein [Tanacetum cinerariifolium]